MDYYCVVVFKKKIYIWSENLFSWVAVRKLPIFVRGRWGSLAEKLSLISPLG